MHPDICKQQKGKAKTKQREIKTIYKMTINDSVLNLVPGKKDIISWKLEKDVLSIKVRKSVAQQLFKLARISSSSCISKDIVERAIARLNYENKVNHHKETIAYEEKMKAWNALNKEQKKDLKKPCKPKFPTEIKVKYTDIYFTTAASRRAFVKSYFLFELLVNELGNKEGFHQEDFIRSLKFKNERIATTNFQRIRMRLQYEGLLYTNTKEHLKSITKRKKYKFKEYKYVFHALELLEDCSGDSTEEYHYGIIGTIKDIISKAYKLETADEHEILEDELGVILRECAGDISFENIYNSLKNNKLRRDNNPNSVWDSTNKMAFTIYIPPYETLSFNGLTNYDLARFGSFSKLKVWLRHHKEKAIVTESTRLFHSFHNIPRDYRKKLAYKGSLLTEVMDVHNCFYVLMLKVMELSELIDNSELRKYENLVRSGKFYEEVEKYVHFGLPIFPDEDGINWSEEYYLWFRGLNKRDLVKKWIQSYRNFGYDGQAYYNHKNIDYFFIKELPSIRKWLFSYPMTKNSKGDIVKRLQSDMCLIESYIISRICVKLLEWGVTPFSLHDGIYLSEEHIRNLRDNFEFKGDNQITEFVSNLFWEEFDSLTSYHVSQLIERNFILLPYNWIPS